MTKKLLFGFLLLIGSKQSSAQCNSDAPRTYYLSQTAVPGEIYRPNGSAWKGGDTIKITGTNYSVIEFYNVGGDACRPLVIMPQTTVTTPVFRFRNNCRYIKVWGGPSQYGIKIIGGALAISKSHHITAENMEISGGSLGVYCKTDYDAADPETWQPGYVMTKMIFRNLWIHDINGEGMYVGHTSPDGIVYNGVNRVPIRMDSVEISNCIVERCQWDGIQVSNARNGTKIFNNTIKSFGMLNKPSQQAGIILGGNTSGDVYNNKVMYGSGNAIELFGYGINNCYDNIVDSTGWDGTANGQHSIYASDYITHVETNPKQTARIYNNKVIKPKPAGAIFVTGYSNNSNPAFVDNNKLCIASPPANWLTSYIKANPANSVISNNALLCEAVGALPVKFVSLAASKVSDKTYKVTFVVEEDADLDHYEIIVQENGVQRVLKVIIPEGQLIGLKTYTQTITIAQ